MSPIPPPLDVRFGSGLHTVYSSSAAPIPSSAIVVAPSLLGAERNVTNFYEIRHELEQVLRKEHSDPDWTFDRNVMDKNGVIEMPSRAVMFKAGAVNDAVRRMCEYFSVDRGSAGVDVLYRRGRPRIDYCSDEGYVRHATIGNSLCTPVP